MNNGTHPIIAIVGAGAILPDAPNVAAFWKNVQDGRYSISEVTKDRWDPALYYDADPRVPDKTYSKLGGWVRQYPWEPMAWHLAVPPRVVDAMDEAQKWAIACTREALEDYGYPKRPLETERTAVILGNAMAGERHYLTAFRAYFAEFEQELEKASSFSALPENIRREVSREYCRRMAEHLPPITEDSMPGELANCIAGRIANLYNFHGPNFVVDAACASAMAAISAAVEGLAKKDFDVAVTGGIDRNMGASTFVKFCKIGALSATGSRPYAEGADGFVMGEGVAILLLKRLEDAEREGDKIYALLRGIGGSSDGRGKGITAPNPLGQKLSIERAWADAGLSPATAGLIEGHGTSTKVGDVVEVQSLSEVLGKAEPPPHSVALGSIKSNIGHLKGAAGAAGLLKTALALRDQVLPPSVHCEHTNPDIDFAHSPLYVNTELREWKVKDNAPRRAGVSAFGFGGTNFHAVLEEYMPGRLPQNGKRTVAVADFMPEIANLPSASPADKIQAPISRCSLKTPLRGALLIGAANEAALAERLRSVNQEARAGRAPVPMPPSLSDLRANERLAIDYADAAELAKKSDDALKALALNQPAIWKALRAQGIFRGRGPAAKVAFLYTGQGSQYANMLQSLRAREPIVAQTFAEADGVLTPLLGKPLSEFIFIDAADPQALARAEDDLRQTAITQPAVLAADIALTRMLAAYGIEPDMTMGHSLGEYGALVAAGALPFEDALEAVSARGREMTQVSVADNGKMAAVFAPLDEIERILRSVNGYVVIANLNSERQAVIGGATKAVEQAQDLLIQAGYNVVELPVSHAFHTSIVAPASEPLRQLLSRLHLTSPKVPTIANVSGEFYPIGKDAGPKLVDILAKQVAAPVQFVKGLRTLYEAGARVFVETGPKKALQGFAEDVLGDFADVLSVFTNHPKLGDISSFNQALCGLYAAGLGKGREETMARSAEQPMNGDRDRELGRLFSEALERGGWQIGRGEKPTAPFEPVVITGAALGLPGSGRIFDDQNVARILRGEQFIDVIPTRFRQAMLDKNVTRLVKSDSGAPHFETIRDAAEVIKLAGRGGEFNLETEFGVSNDRALALDRVTQLAIAAGIDALRDAGIPLVMRYKSTSKGTRLPDRWSLPEALRDDTGIIFASAFPGYDSFADEMGRYYAERGRREVLANLESLRTRAEQGNGYSSILGQEIQRRIDELQAQLGSEPYVFDRRFLFRALSMGHSQFAEFIGARGPNTQINSACATTTQAVTLAEDWIRAGRCRRVVVVSADDVTSDHLLEWIGAGFLASGAAATDEVVEAAALPFDRRRHGLLIGMGAAAMVIESAEAARERGLDPICEVLGSVTANSAFHGSRLDVQHICEMMEKLVAQVETTCHFERREIAPKTVFVSHETYTPARGGSASAEILALRKVFGEAADQVVIANTKGFTGHAMATGIEDVVAVKVLETGCVPPVPNFREVDPELGQLNLSKGGLYDVEYALRLGAGFGSQISLTLLRWTKTRDGRRRAANELGYAYRIADEPVWSAWLSRMAGGPVRELEVVHRTLRVPDQVFSARSEELHAAPVSRGAAPSSPVAVPASPISGRASVAVVPAKSKAIDVASPTDGLLKEHKMPAVEPQKIAQQTAALPAAPSAQVGDGVAESILALVVEKTGYPKDMLDLDLDLEADLGVDTVKQAELFAAIREKYGIPREQNLKLRDFPTLAHVIRFVYDKRPDLASPIAAQKTELTSETQPASGVPISPSKPALSGEGGDDEAIKAKVLEIVAATTGYPQDMLDLDLDLEADLGIDTVKQAEMFAAIRNAYNIPRDANLKLRDFPTLAHVIRFARERQPKAADLPVEPAKPAPATALAMASPGPAAASFEAANRIPRRVPVACLRPPLAVCKTTGVTLGAGSRVVLMPDEGGVGEALAERLRAMEVQVLELDPAAHAEHLIRRLNEWLASGPIQGVYWLVALDREKPLAELHPEEWREAVRRRVKLLHASMRALYEQIAAPGTFLVSGTRLGGRHGYDDAGALAPLGGAVTGFTKAYKRERADALVKAADFALEASASEIAGALVAETLRDPGPVEIGYQEGQRWTVGLAEQPAADGKPGLTLNRNTVFLITGAAGSIVSAITADLATVSGGTFYLLDLVPQPDAKNPDLQRFVSDKEGLKRDLFSRIKERGERATPAMVEKELAALERAQAAQSAMDAVRAAGGTAHYFSVNLTDGAAVAQVIEQVRRESGRIDVLLHAAGLERSHFLPDKDAREFDLVFDVKCDGFFNLLHAIGEMPLGATVVFSSVAGRFGNAGQTDYSAANDLLCKITSSFRSTRPDTRGIAIDWTAWGGIGMATRGSIPQMMELAGIDMLPPEAGVPLIRREITSGGTRGEIVVGQRLGVLVKDWDESGGLDVAAVATAGAALHPLGPMIGRVTSMGLNGGLRIETTLDPKLQPFLRDHQIDGTPVLPGVMGIEAFAEAALLMLPGWHIASIEDVNFLAPFKFYRQEPRTLMIDAVLRAAGHDVAAECSLVGARQLPNLKEPQLTTHFTARVRLASGAPAQTPISPVVTPAGSAIDAKDIYRFYFHGPAYRVLQQAWRSEGRILGKLAQNLPANHDPAERPTLMAPRLIELCFQTAGLWDLGSRSIGLPQHIDSVRVTYGSESPANELFAPVTRTPDGKSFNAEVVDRTGKSYVSLRGYRTIALPSAAAA